MNKLGFWLLMVFGFMCWFLRAVAIEVGSYNGEAKLLTTIGLTVVVLAVLIFGTPNGFIKGFANMGKDKANK